MTTISREMLKGFRAEAQEYVDAVRGILAGDTKLSGQDAAREMHRHVHTLGGAAAMLELESIATPAAAAEEALEPLLEAGRSMSKKRREALESALLQIESELNLLGDGPGTPSDTTAPTSTPLSELPAELLEIFALEAQEHCEVIQTGLEHLRGEPSNKATLSEVRRATHTLKGAAASIGLSPAARLAHLMEELIEQSLEKDEPLTAEATELLFDSADALGELIEPGQANESGVALEAIDTRYQQLLGSAYEPGGALESLSPSDGAERIDTVRRADDLLRVSLSEIDHLINRVGDIIINRAALEGHVSVLDDLLVELDHATRRLRRVTLDIDHQIGQSPLGEADAADSFETFDTLELERYTLLHQLLRELEEVAADTDGVNSELHYLAEELDAALARERRATSELQDGLMATRLVPFHEIETRLRRTVRRTARDLDKSVGLDLIGFETEVDKTILDALADPLMHLLRNAVDHGVETPAVREAAGKPATGAVILKVVRARGRVRISISDDGAGVDVERVRRQAVSSGLLKERDHPTEERVLDLLFVEGFSLTEAVTQTSGRGVGLDIVRRAVRALQGTVRVSSVLGRGTTFTISVPVTLAIARALFVRVGSQTFAVPLDQITAVLRLPADSLSELREGMLHHEGSVLAAYDLLPFVSRDARAESGKRYGLVIEAGHKPTAVLVDGLVGTRDAVIKSLGTHLRRVHGVSGATIVGDGSVVLVLDVPELIEEEQPPWHTTAAAPPPETAQSLNPERLQVLVVDDSLSVRRVVCSFLERVGWQTTAARDGIEALEQIASARPDVALVDIEMPRMNGFELLSRMKTDPDLRHIPVVFLTSRSAAKHRERAVQLGVDGYLVKPYREEELVGELRRVTRERA